jgi:hypothetical protein
VQIINFSIKLTSADGATQILGPYVLDMVPDCSAGISPNGAFLKT